MAFGHEVGLSDLSVPQKGANKKYAKNPGQTEMVKRSRTEAHGLTAPKNREPGSELGKLAYSHKM